MISLVSLIGMQFVHDASNPWVHGNSPSVFHALRSRMLTLRRFFPSHQVLNSTHKGTKIHDLSLRFFGERMSTSMSRPLRWARDWPRHPLTRFLSILTGLVPLAVSSALYAPTLPPIITVRRPTRWATKPPRVLRHPTVIRTPVSPTPSGVPSVGPRTTWLAKIVQAEAGDQPFVAQLAVAAVVLSVILQPGQFQPVSNGTFFTAIPTAQALQAAQWMLHAGPNPAPSALYFYNPALTTNPWMQQLIDCVTYVALRFCAGSHLTP